METVIARFKGGKVTIETAGFVGTSCQEATAALEKALGEKTADRPTDEAYRAESHEIQEQR